MYILIQNTKRFSLQIKKKNIKKTNKPEIRVQ